MKNKILILIIASMFILFAMPFVSAESAFYQSLQDLDFKIPILNADNSPVDQSVNCSINIKYPNQTILVSNALMTYNVGYYNYTISGSQLNTFGQYSAEVYCTDTINNGYSTYIFEVNPLGQNISPVRIAIYILFLILCLIIAVLSIRMIIYNEYEKDKLNYSKLYYDKQTNELTYYLKLLKRKLWIVGVFGLYLSFLVFVAILDNLVFSLSLTDLYDILNNFMQILLWGLIPFTIFWIGYVIVFLYKSTVESMRYQFGSFGGRER